MQAACVNSTGDFPRSLQFSFCVGVGGQDEWMTLQFEFIQFSFDASLFDCTARKEFWKKKTKKFFKMPMRHGCFPCSQNMEIKLATKTHMNSRTFCYFSHHFEEEQICGRSKWWITIALESSSRWSVHPGLDANKGAYPSNWNQTKNKKGILPKSSSFAELHNNVQHILE